MAAFSCVITAGTPLFPTMNPEKGRINFAMLEALAETGLSRLDYRLQSHHVHASAITMALHRYEKNGQTLRITGPSIGNFADAAVASLNALLVTTSAFVVNASSEIRTSWISYHSIALPN